MTELSDGASGGQKRRALESHVVEEQNVPWTPPHIPPADSPSASSSTPPDTTRAD